MGRQHRPSPIPVRRRHQPDFSSPQQGAPLLETGHPGPQGQWTRHGQNRDERHPERYSLIVYDDLHAWQLFLQVDPEVLSAYIENQIGALLDYDRKNGTELVRTLETYFATGQSKQRTAKALYIHRQTLYYRLEQISALLGDNWNAPERRMALDIALAAHRFLSMKKNHTAG